MAELAARANGGAPPGMANPHGVRAPSPRIMPASDLPYGDIEVRVNSKDMNQLEGQKVTLKVTRQSIERGNTDSTLTATTDMRGVATFPNQGTETDFVYQVVVEVGEATYSTIQFQFRTGDGGLRVAVPIFEATSEVDELLILTKGIVALIPQDDLFVADVIWRIENYGQVSWVPKDVLFPLPEGYKALTIRPVPGDVRFEAAGDKHVKLVGTVAPGQHDVTFRLQLPTDGKSVKSVEFPSGIHLGQMRVILDSSPSMALKVDGFPAPEEARNQDGQRRLIASRDFLSEKVRAPDNLHIEVSGIPTPPGGRNVAVGLASAITLFGLGHAFRRRRSPSSPRSELSKEDLERASDLLLEELISLERAFQQSSIGRKTYEQARRQLLEAFARLRTEGSESAA
jgi:hypothetical protein